MLKFFLVAHLTYENQWVKLRNKKNIFVFFGTPYCSPTGAVGQTFGRWVDPDHGDHGHRKVDPAESCLLCLLFPIFLHFFVPAEIDVHQAKAAHPSEHVTPGGRHSPRQFRTAPMPRQEPYCVSMVCTTSNPVPTYPVWLQTIHPIMWHHTRCLLQHRVL